MATLTSTVATLAEWANRTQDGRVQGIVNLLEQTNEITSDMLWMEANGPTSHKTTQVIALPSASLRALNEGVATTVARTSQIEDSMTMIEDYSEVDCKLASLAGNQAEYRLQEAAMHLEGMAQKFAQVLMYGDKSKVEREFNGLLTRYSDSTKGNGANIIKAGGASTGNTSCVLTCWGGDTVHGIFPKGSKAGIAHEDKGRVTIENAGGVTGSRMEAFRDHWAWDCGLSLRDWRYVVAIRNIKVADLVKTGATGADLIDLFTDAVERLPNAQKGRAVFYVPRVVRSFLRRQIQNKANMHLSMEEFAGKKVIAFDGIPVRRVDAISTNETAIA